VLKFSYIGYITQSVTVGARKVINITLAEDAKILDEVVVVGFGTQKKVNLTGAVGTVSADELKERPVANITQALQGMIPGLNIDVSNGSLESRPSINVRGTTTIGEGSSGSPLILIDGMEAELHSVNPQDIASISVLKDAAASSIYGSRAPFGVILITTKSGTKDGKTQINYNNSFRSSSPIDKKHLMNSVDFASWVNDMLTNRGNSVRFGETYMDRVVAWHNATPYKPGQRKDASGNIVYSLEPNTNGSGQWLGAFSNGADDIDYYDVVYRDQNFSQEHNISANGGSQKFNYYLSGSYYGTNGLLEFGKENLDRYTATAKINSELTNWLRVNMNVRFTREDYERPAALTDYFYQSLGF
jgi:TonB-linked SusC/RagA family outer membrane protein